MELRHIDSGSQLGLTRGSAAVCIPGAAGDEQPSAAGELLATLRSVLRHTTPEVPVVVAAPALAVQVAAEGLDGELADGTVLALELAPSLTRAAALAAAASAVSPADIMLVAPGMRLTPGSVERLAEAARSDSIVASATPLSFGAGGVELFAGEDSSRRFGDRDARGDGDEHDAAAVERLAREGLRLCPRAVGIGRCAYVRRAALELVAPLEKSMKLRPALADLATRLVACGMVHVVADDVVVQGPSTAAHADTQEGQHASERVGVSETIANDDAGRLQRALGVVRMRLRGLSVTIDGRALTATVGGTQTYILDLIAALARHGALEVRVLVPPDLSEHASAALAKLPDVGLLSYEQALEDPGLTDVVHRPQPVFTPDDLTLLRLVGRRVVIGQQDLIAYHNFSYHEDLTHWRAYRRTTRLALGAVDQVVFFSEHARRDALAEDLVSEERTHVVGVGGEELIPSAPAAGTPPGGLSSDESFIVCLGADYAHKNRTFALRLVAALHELGWPGRLVLAGSHVPHGSSREREQQLLAGTPGLAKLVVDLGPVDESSKRWLYAHARALLYPTNYEGLGLLPLEAARAGLPCLFAAQASLGELAPEAATLVPWDADASAAAVIPVISDGPARDAHLRR